MRSRRERLFYSLKNLKVDTRYTGDGVDALMEEWEEDSKITKLKKQANYQMMN